MEVSLEASSILLDPLLCPHQFFTLGSKALFFASDNDYGPALWSSDGTPQGTSLLAVLCPACGEARLMGATSTVAFYSVQLDTGEPERPFSVWRTDGTRAGTYPVTGMLRMPAYPQLSVSTVGGRLAYFNACTREQGCEIWSSDGTPEGTGPVADRVPSGGLLFFRALETGGSRRVLWRTDGTPAGTFALGADLSDDLLTLYPIARFATLGDEVFFRASDGAHGAELWNSDGAREGTIPVKDIFPGPAGSYPMGPVAAGDRICFSAIGAGGMELWSSDGTAEGTRRVADIAPGPSWSAPWWLTVAEDQLFFSADDGTHGRELWRSPL